MKWPKTKLKKKLPILLQTETTECGLACIAMVTSYWGKSLDLMLLRQHFNVSLKGSSLKSLIQIAQHMGLQSRPLRLEPAQLPKLKLPCILHWDMNHFVVLKKVTGTRLTIHDPAYGIRNMSWTELSRHFTGVALELTPGELFKCSDSPRRTPLLSILGKVDGLYSGATRLLLIGLVLQTVTLITPFYLQWVLDDVLASNDQQLMTLLGVGFLLLMVLQAGLGLLRSWMTSALSTYLSYQWLGNAFSHLLRLPVTWFEKRHLGDITSRFNSLHAIQKALTTQLIEGVIDGVLVITTFFLMLYYSVLLTSICVLAVSIYATLRCCAFRIQKEKTSAHISQIAKQNTLFIESVRSIQSIRLFGREEERRITWINGLVDQLNIELRISRISISLQSTSTLIFSCERVVVIWLAALSVMSSNFSAGMLLAFLSYKEQFSQRIAVLIDRIFELRILRLHGERVADILLTATEQDTEAAEAELHDLIVNIELRNVSFRYAKDEPDIINDLSLMIPAGECIVITGASGCGKTTLLKLLLGLLKPTKGEILINGISLESLGLKNYRKLVSTVMQDDQLFSGSLSDNICFFDAQPVVDRIIESAQQAAIHDEIMDMPMAYNTLIGDLGSGLSGGQKQRILLARALYRTPRLLVLDEATSHLDAWNEKRVNAAIADQAMTRIMVAHRNETIAMAQRVVTLDKGRISSDTRAVS